MGESIGLSPAKYGVVLSTEGRMNRDRGDSKTWWGGGGQKTCVAWKVYYFVNT